MIQVGVDEVAEATGSDCAGCTEVKALKMRTRVDESVSQQKIDLDRDPASRLAFQKPCCLPP